MTINKKFGKRVRQVRKDLGLSQEELGFKSGLHRTYISDIERGSKNPTIVTVDTLAKALGISISELFKGLWNCIPFTLFSANIKIIQLKLKISFI